MKSQKKKFTNLSIKKEKTLEIKEEPMAQINAVIKKLKKKQKIKNEDLSEMYNEKCTALCEKIENNKIEIENYKAIIFQTQQAIIAKDKEIEGLTTMMLEYKKKAEKAEKEIKEKDEINKNEIKTEIHEDENINKLKEEINELKKEIYEDENMNKLREEINENEINKEINEDENINKLKEEINELKKEINELKKENI